MTKQEIIAGLQNAIVRGESLQKAMQSFVNAGYNIDEVNQASKEIDLGITSKLPEQKTTTPNQPIQENVQEDNQEKPKKKISWKIIILIILLVVLLIGLGLTFFWDKVVAWFNPAELDIIS